MERPTNEYMDNLFRRVKAQIEVSKAIVAKSKHVVAQSIEQAQQHTIEIESYMDAIKIRK
jgi:hypothetical protein